MADRSHIFSEGAFRGRRSQGGTMNNVGTDAEAFDDVDERVMSARASLIAKLDAATDFPALLAGIYASALNGAPDSDAGRELDGRTSDQFPGGDGP